MGSSVFDQHARSSSKWAPTLCAIGALVAASFGPPPICMPMFSTVTAGGGGATESELGSDEGGAAVDADDTAAGGDPTEAAAEGGGSVEKDRWHASQVRGTSGASQRIGAF
jgi:hypothetical protein